MDQREKKEKGVWRELHKEGLHNFYSSSDIIND
jgi:hypothetical protein